MAKLLRSEWRINPAVPETGTLAGRVLAGRGVSSPEAVHAFLHPSIDDLLDPFTLPDMSAACSLIIQALQEHRTIMIHGDYDADGITATALLVRFFSHMGAECRWMIPDRMNDGYGLTMAGTAKIIESGVDLLITVDCGVSSHEEILLLKRSGVRTIVTDHHECPDQLPDAEAVVNPRRPDSICPFPWLSGVGVALKLAQALCARLGLGSRWHDGLPLAALGTVADVVPLREENRIIVREGLKWLQDGKQPGIAALLAASGQSGKPVTSQALSFSVAPRINAAGRLGSAGRALDLLLTDDPAEAVRIAAELADLNRRRQELETAVTDEAIREIDNSFDFSSRDMIIAAREGWHQGVIGIVAARLADHYNRPAIVLTGENGTYRGSGRTAGDFDLLAAISHASAHLVKFGGHRKAAGIVVDAGQLDDFKQKINEYARLHMAPACGRPPLLADAEAAAGDLTLAGAVELQQLEPFGEDNPQPLLIARGMTIKSIRQAGNGRHMKMQLISEQSSAVLDGIAFGRPETDEIFAAGDRIDVLFSLEVNTWQGVSSVSLNIRDLAYARTGSEFADAPWIADSLYREGAGIKTLTDRYGLSLNALKPGRDEYKMVYQFIRARFGEKAVLIDLTLLAAWIARSYRVDFNMFRLSRILAVFEEIRLVSLQPVCEDRVRLAVLPSGQKVRLDDSPAFCGLESGEA